MFIAVKLILYLIAAHVFYTNGLDPTKKVMPFFTAMSCVLLMDICSYFAAKFTILCELIAEGSEDDQT